MGWGLRISVLECCVHSCPWKLLGTGTRGLSAGDGTAGALFSPSPRGVVLLCYEDPAGAPAVRGSWGS